MPPCGIVMQPLDVIRGMVATEPDIGEVPLYPEQPVADTRERQQDHEQQYGNHRIILRLDYSQSDIFGRRVDGGLRSGAVR
jgi:hypothetical protein